MKSLKNLLCIATSMVMLLLINVSSYAEGGAIRYGTPTSSGGPTITEAFIERSLVTYEDGRPVALVSVSGAKNALVQIIDLNDEKIIHTFSLDFTGFCYCGVVTEDGVIYFNVGNKIVEYDPKVKQPVLIGTTPTYRSGNVSGMCWDSEEQILYGGIPNTGNIFKCNPKTKEMSAITCLLPEVLGTGRPDVLGDYVYGGGDYALSDGGSTHLFKINKHTGETVALPDPNGEKITSISQVYAGGKYIFAKMNGIAYIYDTEAEKWIDKTFRWHTSGMSDIFEGKYYFLWDSYIHSIDVETLEIEDFPNLKYGSHLRGNGYFIELEDPEMPGYSFVTAQYNGNLYAFNIQTQKVKHFNVTLNGSALDRRISAIGSDDRVYVMGFKGTKGVAWNPETGEKEYYSSGQGEGICFDPETGLIFTGNYSGAFFYVMDPAKPYTTAAGDRESGTNPWKIDSIGEGQDRPFGMDVVDGLLVTGTLAKAGTVDGALSVIDPKTGEVEIYKNIIPHQSVLTVTHKDNIVYGGTTVTGGGSSIPIATVAHVFSFDMNTRQIVKDVEVKIDGISGNLSTVHGVKIGPDGMLYGATGGVDFVMDPDTLEIVRQKVYGTSFEVNLGANAQSWHEYKMQFDEETGYLFRTGDIIDPNTLEVVCKAPELGQFAGLDSKGNAYFVGGETTIYKVPVIRGDDKSYLLQGLSFFKNNDTSLYKNGSALQFKSYDDNGRMMVPTRVTVQMMNGTVDYDDASHVITIESQSGDRVSFVGGDNKLVINNKTKKLGVYMKVVDGVSYMPLQNLCDIFAMTYTVIDDIYFIHPSGENFDLTGEAKSYIENEVYNSEK